MTKGSRRDFLRAAGVGVVSLLTRGSLAGPSSEESNSRRPNFVIIVADDQGWNDAGCYGHPHIRTPNIDRLPPRGYASRTRS